MGAKRPKCLFIKLPPENIKLPPLANAPKTKTKNAPFHSHLSLKKIIEKSNFQKTKIKGHRCKSKMLLYKMGLT